MAGLLGGELTPLQMLGLGMMGGQSPNFGQNLMQAYQFADQQKRLEIENHIRQMTLEQQQRANEDEAQYRQARSTQPDFTKAQLPSMAPTVENQAALSAIKPPTPYEQALKQLEYLRSKGVADKYLTPYIDQIEKLRPKVKSTEKVQLPGGGVGLANVMESGEYAPIQGASPYERPMEINRGGAVDLVNPTNQKVLATYGKTMSPDQIAQLAQSNQHFWATYGKPQLVEGQNGYSFVTPPAGNVPAGVTPVPGLGQGTKNQPSETELTAQGYAQRMKAADSILGDLQGKVTPGAEQLIYNKYPNLAPILTAGNPAMQQYRQAQEDWVRAKLRKESGAVIADEEMAREIRVYFPQVGDSAAAIKQKAEARSRANDAMATAAGKANGYQPRGGNVMRFDSQGNQIQ